MFIIDIIKRSGRSLKNAKARTLLTALAIAVGTFALTLTLAASNGAQHFVSKIISDNFDPAELIVVKDETVLGRTNTTTPQEYDESFGTVASRAGAATQIKRLSDDDLNKIKNLPYVESTRIGLTVSLQYITRPGIKKYVGTAQAFSPAQNPELLAGSIPKPLGNNKLLLPEGYLKALGFSSAEDAIGKSIKVVVKKSFDQSSIASLLQSGISGGSVQLPNPTNTGSLVEQYTVAGVMKKPTSTQPGTELYIFIGSDDAQRLNDFTTKNTSDYHRYPFVYARIKNGKDATTLKKAQSKLSTLGYSSQSVADTEKFLTQIISILQGIVAAFGAIAVIASVFGIVNTMYISVLQRTREIGLMKALGMRKRDIGRLFRFEAAWIGFLGGIIGSLLAFISGTLLNPWITKKLALGDGNSLLIFKPLQIVILIIILIIIATFAGLLPARKAAKLDPIEALRTE